MVDKYRFIEISEIENGWVVKVFHPDDSRELNKQPYTSTFKENLPAVAEYIKSLDKLRL